MIAVLALGVVRILAILIGVVRRPQSMGVMNVVWPVTAIRVPSNGFKPQRPGSSTVINGMDAPTHDGTDLPKCRR